MKSLTLFILSLFCLTPTFSQGWEEVGTGVNALKANSIIGSLCYDKGNGKLYAAGGFSNGENSSSGNKYVAMWNGASWQCLCSDVSSLRFLSGTSPICVDKYHNVYATGHVDTLSEYIVVKWNGATWATLGEGITSLNAEGNIFAMCSDNVGNLYVAGMFTNAAGYYYVAKWDGTSWSELGTGSAALNANNWINALAADKYGNIYAAGWFYNLGYQYVAKWDGSSWQKVGVGSNPIHFSGGGGITALYIDDDDNVYAGGSFRNAEGHQYVAKWDGTDWYELGTAVNKLHGVSNIETITGDKWGNIYAAGILMGGKYHVAKWNGTAWAEVGTGSNKLNANGDIYSICTDTLGTLYAAGMFTDRVNADSGYKYVAKFNTTTSVTNITEMGGVHVWPNPVQDVLYVSDMLGCDNYYICDMTGTVKKIIHNNNNRAVQTIAVAELSTGVYLLRNEHGASLVFNKM